MLYMPEKEVMQLIAGNTTAEIQICRSKINCIGEPEKCWETVQILKGFLDLLNGGSDIDNFNANLEMSTHVFICDFVPLHKSITSENSRMIIGSLIYEVLLIDNPMEKNRQYEIFLKFSGGYDEVYQ